MKTFHLSLLALCLLASTFLAAQVTNNLQVPTSMNTDGTAPDASAMLDVQSTTQGLLVPRLTTSQRTAIPLPANGLLVFDTDTGSFWYFTNSDWFNLSALPNSIADTDGNTKVQTEESPDENIIRFDAAGSERLKLTPDSSVFNGLLKQHDGGLLLLGTTGATPIAGDGARLMWIPEKRAFRAGEVGGGQWDDANIGYASFAGGGFSNTASGDRSFIGGGIFNTASGIESFIGGGSSNTASGTVSFVGGGFNNLALGLESFVGGGISNTASGDRSFTGGGNDLFAKSFSEAVFGTFNTDYAPASASSFNAADRLFVIGNGPDNDNRSNAVTVLKSGNVGIGTETPAEKLEVDGAIKIADTTTPSPAAGTIRWNPATEDFEGHTGTQWKSLTDTGTKFWGNTDITYNSTESNQLTASDANNSDNFGISVAISGDYAIIGAWKDDDGGSESGSAYIFQRTGGTWMQQAKLTASDAAADDLFGRKVSISGNNAIVAAYWNDDAGSNSGSAYIFEKPGGGWADMTETVKLTASDAEAGDFFGSSVAISGDYAIVGAERGDNTGSAYVFYRDGSSWTEQAKLLASDAGGGDEFGVSVAISGDFVIIGARDNDDGGSNSGSAYIFQRSGSSWTEQAKLTASDAAADDVFGSSVAISGDYAIIGAAGNDDAGSSSGSAYIFEKPSGGWADMTETVKLAASDAAAGDQFGIGVAISGDYAIVGASKNDDDGTDAGSAYIFHRSSGTWMQQAKLTASSPSAFDEMGLSVAISGGYAIVGAHNEDSAGPNSGAAYIFE